MVEPYKPLYTVKEAAKVLMVSENDLNNLLNKGKLPFLILGRRKIKGADLETFINNHPVVPIAEQGIR